MAETRDAIRLREIARQLTPMGPQSKSRTLTAGTARDMADELRGIADRIGQPCQREHVPYRSSSRSDNRFFGDENNG